MNMHNTVQTWSPFRAFKKQPGKIQMNGSRQAHFCFNVCLWLPEIKCCNFDLYQLYIFMHLPACLTLLQELLAPPMGRDTGDGYTQQFCVCRMGISPAQPSARGKGHQDQGGAQVLIGSCLWVWSLSDSYKLWQLNILW